MDGWMDQFCINGKTNLLRARIMDISDHREVVSLKKKVIRKIFIKLKNWFIFVCLYIAQFNYLYIENGLLTAHTQAVNYKA